MPDIVSESVMAHVEVETKSDLTYGQVVIDTVKLSKKEGGINICRNVDSERFKKLLFEYLK